jgi:glycosyltransferase involved in cell wall biosynthesis
MTNQPTVFVHGFDLGYKDGFQSGFHKGFFKGKDTGHKYMECTIGCSSSLADQPISVRSNEKHSYDVIISAFNEARTINQVIHQVKRIADIREIFVVVNGSTDDTAELARQAGAKVVEYKNLMGYDVGRAIGAQHSDADGILFLDGDIVIDAMELVPYLEAIADGIDVALNDITSLITSNDITHSVVIGKYFINLAANRSDLGPNTMTAVPHALSRRAIDIITPANLAVPPKAQLIAIKSNLIIRAVKCIDVISTNRIRPTVHQGPGVDLVENLIMGDHLEALNYLFNQKSGMN